MNGNSSRDNDRSAKNKSKVYPENISHADALPLFTKAITSTFRIPSVKCEMKCGLQIHSVLSLHIRIAHSEIYSVQPVSADVTVRCFPKCSSAG